MIEGMFIENCSSNMSYRELFEECRSISCTITSNVRGNVTTVIVVLLGIHGKFTFAQKLFLLCLLFLIHRFIRKRYRIRIIQVHPQSYS